jgi:hypothetical protein
MRQSGRRVRRGWWSRNHLQAVEHCSVATAPAQPRPRKGRKKRWPPSLAFATSPLQSTMPKSDFPAITGFGSVACNVAVGTRAAQSGRSGPNNRSCGMGVAAPRYRPKLLKFLRRSPGELPTEIHGGFRSQYFGWRKLSCLFPPDSPPHVSGSNELRRWFCFSSGPALWSQKDDQRARPR